MSASDDPIVIVGMARTPMGGLLGELAPLSANELGAIAVKAAIPISTRRPLIQSQTIPAESAQPI